MTDFDNTNSGVLFKNRDKTPEKPNWADYQGNGEIKCPHCGSNILFWLSAWLKTAKKSGEKFMSLAFKMKGEKSQHPAREQARQAVGLPHTGGGYDNNEPPPYDDSDVPF